MKRLDLAAVLRDERDMQLRGLFVRLKQAQRRIGSQDEFDAVAWRAFGTGHHAERCQRGEIEGFARFVVANAEFDVVEHARSPIDVAWPPLLAGGMNYDAPTVTSGASTCSVQLC